MNAKLINLSLYLNAIGLEKESSSIARLAQQGVDYDAFLKSFIKTDSLFSEKEKEKTHSLDKVNLSKWENLLAATKGESTFHYEIKLSQISRLLKSKTDNLRSKYNIPVASNSDKRKALKALKEKSFNLDLSDRAEDQDFSRLAKNKIDYNEIYKNIDRTTKNLKSELTEDYARFAKEIIEKEDLKKEAIAKKLTEKALKAFPYAGLALSLSLFTKNLIEAYNNFNIIINNLPLSKYGLSPAGVISPTFLVDGTYRHLNKEIEENSNNPENLMELLEIISVLKVFHLDAFFTLTNGIALFLDVIALILTGAPDLLSTAAGLVFAAGDFIFQLLVLTSIEIAGEFAADWYWDQLKENIANIAESAIKK